MNGEDIVFCTFMTCMFLLLVYIFVIMPLIDSRTRDLKGKLLTYAKFNIGMTLPDGYEIYVERVELENPILGIPMFSVIDCYMEYTAGLDTYSYKFMSTKPWEFTKRQHDRFYKAFQETDFGEVCQKCYNKYMESVIEEAC